MKFLKTVGAIAPTLTDKDGNIILAGWVERIFLGNVDGGILFF